MHCRLSWREAFWFLLSNFLFSSSSNLTGRDVDKWRMRLLSLEPVEDYDFECAVENMLVVGWLGCR